MKQILKLCGVLCFLFGNFVFIVNYQKHKEKCEGSWDFEEIKILREVAVKKVDAKERTSKVSKNCSLNGKSLFLSSNFYVICFLI